MKKHFFLWAMLLVVLPLTAEVHITINNPDSWIAQELSPYVGQEVVFDTPMILCSNYGTYVISPRRFFSPTNQAVPGTAECSNVTMLNQQGRVSLYGVYDYHRCGEKIYNLKARVNSASYSGASLSFLDGEWRGNTRADLEAGIPDLGDYRLLVCAMNLEYYIASAFDPTSSMGPDDLEEHKKQRTKVSKALTRINADIFGFVEIEQGPAAVQEIADDLNANLPGRNYTYVDDNTTSKGTFTRAAFVYDANVVEPAGVLRSASYSTIGTERHRMICFREKATGEKFILSLNHFKAKRGTGTGADADQGNGVGSFNATRLGEAQAVVTLYKSYYPAVRDKDVLIMGDLNAYAKEDPIMLFTEKNDMIDLHRAYHADTSYSYQYGGTAGYLDHAICNLTLYPQVTGMSGFHINSDELDSYTYDQSDDQTMFRCSDHDPVLVGLKLDSTLSGDPYFNGGNFAQDSLTFYYPYAPGEENLDPKMYFDIFTISGYPVCAPTRIEFYGIKPEEHKKYYTFSSDNPNLPDEIKRFLPLPSGLYVIHFYFNGSVKSHKLIVK